MEKELNIYKKLQNARVQLQNKNLKKSGKNNFANFNYYELADFLPSINEIFDNVGLFSSFSIDDKEAYLIITNIDNPNETIRFSSPTAEAEIKGCTPIQCLGGIHTYMKRYLYLNALEIVESDMFDSKVGDKKDPLVEGKKEVKQEKPNYRDLIYKYCDDKGIDVKEIAQKYKLNAKTTNDEFEKVYFDLTLYKEN